MAERVARHRQVRPMAELATARKDLLAALQLDATHGPAPHSAQTTLHNDPRWRVEREVERKQNLTRDRQSDIFSALGVTQGQRHGDAIHVAALDPRQLAR